MRVLYGKDLTWCDVTVLARKHYTTATHLLIPAGDGERAALFGDNVNGTLKEIRVEYADGSSIHTIQGDVVMPLREPLESAAERRQRDRPLILQQDVDAAVRLAIIHKQVRLFIGSMMEEYPEQLLAVKYVRPEATVLELGGNFGRNSCTIASLLDDDRRLVSVESFSETANQLRLNRNNNDFHFHVEAAALSRVPLAQQGWVTIPYDGVVPAGYTAVNTIPFEALEAKYELTFDTIVADCEGALAQILRDEPTLFKNITTLVVENDYIVAGDKEFVDMKLEEYGLKLVHSEAGGWGAYQSCFYQVYQR